MTFTEPKNANYAAVVVALENFVTLPNCSNVKAALIFGNSVIVGINEPAGAVGLFFPAESALSEDFLKNNNLYRKPEMNADPTAKGYFEHHGRVKAVLFRGNKSEGFWIPLASLSYLGLPLSEFPVGSVFDQVNDHMICQKYTPRRNKVSNPCAHGPKKARVEDKLVDGQFRFHIDTAQLGRNLHRIEPHTIISISDKWHGTSAIFSHILVRRDLSWIDRIARWFGVNVRDSEYGYTWASRRVVKGVDGEAKKGAVHYYSDDIWGIVAKKIQESIPKGFTLYGEIVGYMPDGGMIQKGYHYGCQQGSHRFLVYRVTSTNADGKVNELGWPQMQEFCTKYGFEMVRQFYYGRADRFLPVASTWRTEDEWREALFQSLQNQYVNDQMCPHNNMEVPAEGIVVRIERYDECESYKLKSFKFKEWESKMADEGVVDVETQEGEILDA